MSLLTIVQDVADEVGVVRPATVIGNSEQTAVRLLRLSEREGNVLRRRYDWQALATTATITTAAGTAAYDLPADFARITNATWWNKTEQDYLWGPATAPQWQAIKNGVVTQPVDQWFRILGNKFEIYPAPDSAQDIVFEYISTNWIDTDGDDQGDAARWQADDDEALFDDDLMTMGLVWRFLSAEGLPYAEQFNEYQRVLQQAMGADGGAGMIDLSGDSGREEHPLRYNLPETGFGQ